MKEVVLVVKFECDDSVDPNFLITSVDGGLEELAKLDDELNDCQWNVTVE